MPPKGWHPTPESRARMSASHKGKPPTPEQLVNLAAMHQANRGRPLSPERRAKIGAAQRGRSFTPEHLTAIRDAHARKRGVPLSAEHRAALIGIVHPEASSRMRGNTLLADAPIKGECVYCFEPARGFDHVIPRGRLGWDDPDNIVIACYSCNTSKNNRTPEEWLAGMKAPRTKRQHA